MLPLPSFLSLQVLLAILLLANLLDLFYSFHVKRTGGEVATFQYLTPTLLILTTVSRGWEFL